MFTIYFDENHPKIIPKSKEAYGCGTSRQLSQGRHPHWETKFQCIPRLDVNKEQTQHHRRWYLVDKQSDRQRVNIRSRTHEEPQRTTITAYLSILALSPVP